jgi:hypothetical protein
MSTKLLLWVGLALLIAGFAGATVPKPLSFYDFEDDATGTVVKDQSSAANNGELMGDGYVEFANGGIITTTGDSTGCLHFTGGAFEGVGFVAIPFQEFLNSPNYTLSAWVQWEGTADWGYVFWAQGETWPEEDKSRHIDVWWNPSNKCWDNILNTESGADFQINYLGDDVGVDPFDMEWHLVVATLENNATYTIYADGIPAATATTEDPIIANDGDDLWLGGRPNNVDNTSPVKMLGYMDRVRIWDKVLTEAQVNEILEGEGSEGGKGIVWEGDTNVQPENQAAINCFSLLGNYPNPFNPSTQISYVLDRTDHTTLCVYDMLGRSICTLVDGIQSPGQYTISWNGLDNQGRSVPGGVYFYRLASGSRTSVSKMTLLK